LVAALQTTEGSIGQGALAALHASQLHPPAIEPMLTSLLNEIAAILAEMVLVLDDHHVIEDEPMREALTFLLEHLPDNMRLVIATRSDPPLNLARFRGRWQLTELRSADLRLRATKSPSCSTRSCAWSFQSMTSPH
jgi:LuxR family maltose regulon positive regulatory protein